MFVDIQLLSLCLDIDDRKYVRTLTFLMWLMLWALLSIIVEDCVLHIALLCKHFALLRLPGLSAITKTNPCTHRFCFGAECQHSCSRSNKYAFFLVCTKSYLGVVLMPLLNKISPVHSHCLRGQLYL